MKLGRILAGAVGLALLVWAVSRVGLGPLLSAISELGPAAFALIVACQLALAAPAGLAWALLAYDDARPRAASFVRARLVREAGAQLLPFAQLGGAAMGVRVLMLEGVAAPAAASSAMADMTVELTSQLVYVGLGAAALEVSRPGMPVARGMLVVALTLAALATALVIVRTRPALAACARLLHRLFRGRARRVTAFVVGARSGGRASPSRIAAAWGLHLLAWGLSGAQTWLIFRFLGERVPFAGALAIDSLTSGAKAAAFAIPGGLGVQEAALMLFSGLFGAPPAAALALSLARRCRDLGLALPVLAFWRLGSRRAAGAPQAR